LKKKNIFKAWVHQYNKTKVSQGIKNNLKQAYQRRQYIKSQPNLSLPRKQYDIQTESRKYIPMSSQNTARCQVSTFIPAQPFTCRNDERKDLLAHWQKDYSKKFKMHHLLNDKLPKYLLADAFKVIKKFAISKEFHTQRKVPLFLISYRPARTTGNQKINSPKINFKKTPKQNKAKLSIKMETICVKMT
jgi:hypothetical protein